MEQVLTAWEEAVQRYSTAQAEYDRILRRTFASILLSEAHFIAGCYRRYRASERRPRGRGWFAAWSEDGKLWLARSQGRRLSRNSKTRGWKGVTHWAYLPAKAGRRLDRLFREYWGMRASEDAEPGVWRQG